MKVLIIGAGKVGFNIAQFLEGENHDVTVIELDETRAQIISDNLDIQVITGNGASYPTLEEAEAHDADLVVAVTQSDELNIFASILAKSVGVKRTIARVRNPDYDFSINNKITKEKLLGIDLIINPEKVTAKEIAKLISVPELVNIEYYAEGKLQLMEIKVKEGSQCIDIPLKELNLPSRCVIVSVLREENMIIPTGNDVIQSGDYVFVLARTTDMINIENFFKLRRKKINTVTVLGGGRISYYLAKILEKKKINVKIIESDPKKCDELAKGLNSIVINGDVSDIALLKEEGIENSDFLISLTSDDKLNLLTSLFSKHFGVDKTITQIRRSDYIPLMEKLGLENIISPRILTAAEILRFIRSEHVISLSLLGGAKAQLLELVIKDKSIKVINKTLKEIAFPDGAIIGAIVRKGEIIIPKGDDVLMLKDRLVIFALPESLKKVSKMFNHS